MDTHGHTGNWKIKDMLLECFINVNYIKKEEASGFSSWCVCELLFKKLICFWLRWVVFGACNVWASQSFSYCDAWSKHVGFSWTREHMHVPCAGRRILDRWRTREVLWTALWWEFFLSSWVCCLHHAQCFNKRASLTVKNYYICCNSYLLRDSVKQTFYKSLRISSLKEMGTGGCVNPGGTMIAF